MKKVVLLFLVYGAILYGAFENVGYNARAKALADAFYTQFEGVESMNYNPAGIAHTKSIETIFSFYKPYSSFNDNTLIYNFDGGVVIPFTTNPYYTIWFSWIFKLFTWGNEGFFVRDSAVGLYYHQMTIEPYKVERVATLSYAKNLNDVISKGAKISAGVNFDFYWDEIMANPDTQSNPLLAGRLTKFAFGIDVGVTYDFSETIRLAFVVDNLLRPNIAHLEGQEEYLPRIYKAGAHIKWERLFFFKKAMFSFGAQSIGREDWDNREMNLDYRFGFEWWELKDKLAIRLGYRTGMSDSYDITAGLGYRERFKSHEIIFDFAFDYPNVSQSYKYMATITYRFSLPRRMFNFDKKKLEGDILQSLAKEEDNVIIENTSNTNDTANIKVEKKNLLLEDIDKTEKSLKKADKEKQAKKKKTILRKNRRRRRRIR